MASSGNTLDQLDTALAALLSSVDRRMDSLEQRFDARLGAIDARLDAIDARLDATDARLGAIDARLESTDARLGAINASLQAAEASRAVGRARTANGLKALRADLVPLPFDRDGRPWPPGVAQPRRMIDLAVSGAEHVPGETTTSGWNRGKSKAFLAAAVDGYSTDGTDGEGEAGAKSRTARLKVIDVMGGSYERVIGAVYALN